MKKKIRIIWIILGIVLILFLCFSVALVFTLPYYDAFQKEVASYVELKKTLQDSPEICLPDPFTLDLQDASYALVLDDRNIFANAIGYNFIGTTQMDDVTVFCGFRCDNYSYSLWNPNITYRNISLEYDIYEGKGDSPYKYVTIDFVLGEHHYNYWMKYDYKMISQEAQNAINDKIYNQLLAYSREVIDAYENLNSGD